MGLVKLLADALGVGGGGIAVASREYGLAESYDGSRPEGPPSVGPTYPSQSESAALLDAALTRGRAAPLSAP